MELPPQAGGSRVWGWSGQLEAWPSGLVTKFGPTTRAEAILVQEGGYFGARASLKSAGESWRRKQPEALDRAALGQLRARRSPGP
jgi:hypothetical protein